MPPAKPDLRFGPGSSDGFTASGIAAFDDLRPAAVIRELIQNSLDAARLVETRPAIVRFRLSEAKLSSIPGIKSYMNALKRAFQTQKELAGGQLARQAELVKERISTTLCEDRVNVLSILDNGIGLDERRMTALLSDGLSVKGKGATGTYGNGHSTAIPASDLRYVLYGGITANGRRIAAGHAVLASHRMKDEKHPRSAHGYFIREFNAGPGKLYNFATSDQIPQLIRSELDQIQHYSGHGTVVSITAFNNFMEDDKQLWDMVSLAASANFFVAITEGELEVQLEDVRKGKHVERRTLDQNNLAEILELHRENRRARGFLSGVKAFEAYSIYRDTLPSLVTTSQGLIDIRIADNPSGVPRVDLCRNGMWITSEMPSFQGKFADRTPFHAVLSLKSEDGGRLHDLVRTAEGPLHDKLVAKRLEDDDRRDFYKAMEEIIKWLKEHTKAVDSEAFASDEFLTLNFGIGEAGAGGGVKAFQGTPTVIDKRPVQQLMAIPGQEGQEGGNHDENPGGKPRSSVKRDRTRPSLSALVQAASRVIANGRHRIHIEFARECEDAQLRLVVDEGIDATCDRHGLDPYSPAELNNVSIDGKPVNREFLEHQGGNPVGVRLGDVAKGTAITLEADIRLNGDFSNIDEPSLRIEVFRTPKLNPKVKPHLDLEVAPEIQNDPSIESGTEENA